MKVTNVLRTFDLFWSPEGRKIATVQARNSLSAIRKAPQPYRRALGEIYAIPHFDGKIDGAKGGR